ncbi:hypothetical protein PFISCL1PPCAC_768, partial [Pristionchus fissidentatus]
YLLFLLSLVSFSQAGSPLYIEELEDIVRGYDHHLLDTMDDDKWTTRSELKLQLDEILARQSPATQDLYARIVKDKERRREAKNNYWVSES